MQDQPQAPNQTHKPAWTRSTLVGLGVLLVLLIGLPALLKLWQERNPALLPADHAAKLAAGFQLRHTLEANGSSIMEWSPDGRTLATLRPQALALWDAQTGRLAGSYTMLKRTTSLRWSPDSDTLAAGYQGEARIELWGLTTGP
jgi:WD40 repeat protein